MEVISIIENHVLFMIYMIKNMNLYIVCYNVFQKKLNLPKYLLYPSLQSLIQSVSDGKSAQKKI